MPKLELVIGDARSMGQVADESVHLVVTSPPYWQLKDYRSGEQIGYHESYDEYVASLSRVWDECERALHPGCRMCINIGDQFARAAYYGRYKVIPIRTEIIRHCEAIGLDYMGAIIWQKVTTSNPTGGATVMGSYPYPRNGVVTIDYEFILIFKKLGKAPKPSAEHKDAARMTHEQWVEYFAGHWNFPGERNSDHIAAFPEELPRRLMRMYSFPGERVLDPFLGSGTTMKVAADEGRDCIGYEIDREMQSTVEKRLSVRRKGFASDYSRATDRSRWEAEATAKAAENGLQDRSAEPADYDFGGRVAPEGAVTEELLIEAAEKYAEKPQWREADRKGRLALVVECVAAVTDAEERLVRLGARNAMQRDAQFRKLIGD